MNYNDRFNNNKKNGLCFIDFSLTLPIHLSQYFCFVFWKRFIILKTNFLKIIGLRFKNSFQQFSY